MSSLVESTSKNVNIYNETKCSCYRSLLKERTF